MKRMVSLLVLAGGLLITGQLALSARATAPRVERATVQFSEQVKLLDVFLKGRYIFVHDQAKMDRGEPCTYIYTYRDGAQGDLVTSFHCVPVERAKVENFSVLLSAPSPISQVREVTEFQFAGSTEAHQIPKT